jgi:hypothetical protein
LQALASAAPPPLPLTTEAERLLAGSVLDCELDVLALDAALPGLSMTALAMRLLDSTGVAERLRLDRVPLRAFLERIEVSARVGIY